MKLSAYYSKTERDMKISFKYLVERSFCDWHRYLWWKAMQRNSFNLFTKEDGVYCYLGALDYGHTRVLLLSPCARCLLPRQRHVLRPKKEGKSSHAWLGCASFVFCSLLACDGRLSSPQNQLYQDMCTETGYINCTLLANMQLSKDHVSVFLASYSIID